MRKESLNKIYRNEEVSIGRLGNIPEIGARRLVDTNPQREYGIIESYSVSEKRTSLELMFEELTKKERELAEANAKIKELEEKAYKDPLTGLYNRTYLEECCKKSREENNLIKNNVVVFADGNGLGAFNKEYGYEVGDKYLKAISEIITSAVRTVNPEEKNDVVARWGGDEFVIVIKDATIFNPNIGQLICDRIGQKIEEYNEENSEKNGWSVSFAVGHFESNNCIGEAIQAASKEMQNNKDASKSLKTRNNL